MTDVAIELLITGPRSATFRVDAERHLHMREEALAWQVRRLDGALVAEGTTSKVVFTVASLEPGATYHLHAGEARLEFITRQETALIDIRDFGASTDAQDNAPAIQRAIAELAPGGTLRIPAGRWLSGPIFLKSGMTLLVEDGAELAAIASRQDFPILPARHADGRILGTWEGVAEACYASLINAIDCHDVHLAGTGIIDGGGDRGDWWSWPKETRRGARRPRTVFLSACENVTLSGLTIRNSPSWTVHPVLCKGLIAADLTIENDPDSPNTDGFNPESSSDIHLVGLHISVGDDCIALKAGKRSPLGGPDRPTEHVLVENCLMERGHGAVVIGSEMSAGISDITIRNCHFRGTDRGLRIKTRRGRGGTVTDIRLTDSLMEDVATPVAVNSFYFCDADGRSDYVQSRSPLPVSTETPSISSITVKNVTVSGARTAAAVFYGLPEAAIRDIAFENYTVSFAPDAEAEVPEMASLLLPLRHAGIVAENAVFSRLARLSPVSIHPAQD
ncbi:glycoside hydrolase family 28 protein [Neorhizobium galegae]|uniref:Glycoside hydrolase family 28 protein n=1 Tax=Neorhizobium galegae TaxID=399 RepID=A0A6A1THK8_NEOGA|nr:glycoside hydrolase family 28 protein [Neorhizobium galegae]KAB1083031.1 glycoside hydrolase family 28 protein [Neorhizobium galegae]